MSATPAVSSYNCYIYPQATVATTKYTGKRNCASPIFKFRLKPGLVKRIFAVCTAVNATGEGTASSVGNAVPFQGLGLGTGGANA